MSITSTASWMTIDGIIVITPLWINTSLLEEGGDYVKFYAVLKRVYKKLEIG
jgi:hypothetical protein